MTSCLQLSSILWTHIKESRISASFFQQNVTRKRWRHVQRAENLLKEKYLKDFEECFPSELLQFSAHFKSACGQEQRERQSTNTELNMVLLLNENTNEHRFPNVHITLNIYMSASNCSGEQSFSKLKWIKKLHGATAIKISVY